jgi:nitrogen regulatory protein P-II 1
MRKIEAVIRPDRLQAVQEALQKTGYPGVMVTEMMGHGRQFGGQAYWPENLRETFLPKVKLEIVVTQSHLEKVVTAILKAAKTGEPGDGKIFISDIRDALRVRTGERGRMVVETPKATLKSPPKKRR